MKYPLITIIIAVIWIAMLTIAASFPDIAQSIFYITMLSTVVIFYIGFQMKSR